MKAEILAVGSELLTPFRTDTNSLWLTEQLNEIGIEVQAKGIAGDERRLLCDVLARALNRADLVLMTGGLGPTEDDLTRDAVAEVAGVELVLRPKIVEELRERFAKRGYTMTANNERQAMLPEAARVLPNPNGTAPGFTMQVGGKTLVVLPGPPRELKPMFADHVRPMLPGGAFVLVRRVLRVNGMGESALDTLIAPLYRHLTNPSTTILFTEHDIEIHLCARAETHPEAAALVDELAEKIVEQVGSKVYSRENESLPEVLCRELGRRRWRMASAESCSGGKIAARMTALEGCGEVFAGGIVAYSLDAKLDALGVPAELLETKGAYSLEVAEAMAQGAQKLFKADVGVATTGVAGPMGGTEENPVGTVYLGLAGPEGVESRKIALLGDRDLIASRASQAALDWLRLRYLS